jgi:serine O-acetyltransferase
MVTSVFGWKLFLNKDFQGFYMTFYELREYVKSDLYRYTGRVSLFGFLRYYFFARGFHYTCWMRLTTYFYSKLFYSKLFYIIARLNLYRLSTKYGIEISHKVRVGKGFYIGHFGCVVVSNDAVIGDNVNLSQGVTIGQSNRGKLQGVPIIGNEVYIGPGAKLFGGISLGEGCAVGANCVVNRSFSDDSVIVGIPGKMISNNGSDGYIQNKWCA